MLRALLERDIVPDVVIGTSAGALNGAAVAYAPNLTGVAQLAAVWEQLADRPRLPRRAHPPGLERRAPRHPPLRQRGPRGADPPLAPRPARSPISRSRCASSPPTSTPARRSCSPAGRSSPRSSRAPRCPACSRSSHHDGRRLVDGGVVNNVPLWHALSGPVDRVFVLNVSSGVGRPRGALAARRRDDELHARPQPALRARAAARARPRSRSIELPRPPRPARSVRLLRRARADRRRVRARQRGARPGRGRRRATAASAAAAPPLAPVPPTGVIAAASTSRRSDCGVSGTSSWVACLGEVEHAAGHDAEEEHRRRPAIVERDAGAGVDPGARSSAARLRLVVGRRVHREHDAQVDERARSRPRACRSARARTGRRRSRR